MTIEEMQGYLTDIQKELPTTKILNAIMAQQQDIDTIRTALVEVQEKVNEIISAINGAAATGQEKEPYTNEEIEYKEEATPIED